MEHLQLHLRCAASPERARPIRHVLGAFLNAVELDVSRVDDVLTAVGEAVANVMEHAYGADGPAAGMELLVRIDDDRGLSVEVVDHGHFLERPPRPDRGFGLRIVRAIATRVSIERTDSGTTVKMLFDVGRGERTDSA